MKSEITSLFSYKLGTGIVFFFFNVFWTAILFYFLDWKISFWNLSISFFIVVGYWFVKDRNRLIKYIMFFLGFLVLTLVISKYIFDQSGDGQSYHQEATIQIALDWNPLNEVVVPDVWDSTHAVWMNHFPRFSWIVQGLFYKVFDNLEMSKFSNLMFMVANFSVAWAFLKSKFKRNKQALVLSLLATFNPICVSESNTFCVDTIMASLFTILMWNVFIFFDRKESKKTVGFSMFLTIVILFNVKVFTLAYLFVLMLTFLVYFLIKKSNLWKDWLLIFVLSGIFGILVLGFNPYITNTIKFGSPIYPFYLVNPVIFNKSFSPHIGEVKNISKYIMKANSPVNFFNKNWLINFGKSIFSRSANIYFYSMDNKYQSNARSALKWPFLFNNNELNAFIDSDVRVAGFGVWFSGAVVLSILLTFGLMFKKNKNTINLVFIFLLILAISWTNPESWWARYVPFLWLIPIITMFFCFKTKEKWLKFGAWILGLVLTIDVFFILVVIIPFQIRQTKLFISRYHEMFIHSRDSGGLPVKVDFVTTRAWRTKYFERNIPFVESKMEVGVMENYFFKNLSETDILLLNKSYVKDEIKYEYNLKENVSAEDLKKLSLIFAKLAKVPLFRRK